jgi:hypothetical protein
MSRFNPSPKRLVVSELIESGYIPDLDDALRLCHDLEEEEQTNGKFAIGLTATGIIGAGVTLAFCGAVAPLLVPIAAIGAGISGVWNHPIRATRRDDEADFLRANPAIIPLIEQKLNAGEADFKVSSAYQECFRAWRNTGQPLALPSVPTAQPLPASPVADPVPPVGEQIRFEAVEVPIVAPSLESSPAQTQPTLNMSSQTGERFDWARLDREYNDFPHLFLLGKTGAGKSWLSDRLVRFLTGFAVVISPKKMPSDFVGLQVIGLPYQYRAIHRALVALEKLMVDREAEMQRTGNTDFIPINVILDELPVSSSGCKDLDLDLLKPLKALIRAGRTSKIRLIILAQGSEVKALGIEGEGGLRDSLTYVYLKGFVEDHAAKNKIDISQVDRPCIIEGQIADTSFLSNYESIAKQGLNLTGAIPQFSESEAKKLERMFNLPAADHAVEEVEEDAIESVSSLDAIRSAFPGWKPKSQDVAAKIVDWMAARADKTFLPGEVRKSIRLLKDDETLTIDRVKKLLDLLTEKQFLSSDEAGRYAIAQSNQQTDDYDF